MLSFIWLFVFEFLINEVFFFISLIFSTFIDFHNLRNTIEIVTILNNNFVNIEMWSNDWLIFDLVLQCFILLIRSFDINIKSMMLWKFLAFQVIVFYERINFMSALIIISINWFIMTCCVNLDDSLQSEWCRLKSFSKIWFVSILFTQICFDFVYWLIACFHFLLSNKMMMRDYKCCVFIFLFQFHFSWFLILMRSHLSMKMLRFTSLFLVVCLYNMNLDRTTINEERTNRSSRFARA